MLEPWQAEAKVGIPTSLQADILFKFSEDLMLDLEKIRKDLAFEQRVEVPARSAGRFQINAYIRSRLSAAVRRRLASNLSL